MRETIAGSRDKAPVCPGVGRQRSLCERDNGESVRSLVFGSGPVRDDAVERAVSAGRFTGVGNDLIDIPRNPAGDEEFTAVCRRPGPGTVSSFASKPRRRRRGSGPERRDAGPFCQSP